MRCGVAFSQEATALDVRFENGSAFACGFGVLTDLGRDVDHYAGEYDVVPGREGTVLETKDLMMDDDVTVHPIPFFQVSNLSGGKTCYIGGPQDIEITARRQMHG